MYKLEIMYFVLVFAGKKNLKPTSEIMNFRLVLHFALLVLVLNALDVKHVVASDQHLTEIAC